MSLELTIFVYAIALAILVLEAFIPSGGVLAVVGSVALMVSIYYSFVQHSVLMGVIQSLIAVIFIPAVVYFGFKKMTLRKNLEASEGFTSEKAGLAHLVTKTGSAYTNLRPSGIAIIDGKKVDVVTEGDMIDKDTPVKVIRVEGNRVIVRDNSKHE